MDHIQVQEHFSDFWDKSLDEETRKQVEAHLAECAACREEYAAFTRAMAPLGKLNRMPAPTQLPQSVSTLLHRRSKGRFFGMKTWRERLTYEWLSFAMLGLVALIYLLMKWMHPAMLVR